MVPPAARRRGLERGLGRLRTRGHALGHRAPGLEEHERALQRRLGPIDEGLRRDAHPEDQDQERHEHQTLAERQVTELLVLGVGDRTEHHALEHPQHVHGGEDHADRRERGPPHVGAEGSEQHQELADESVGAGQPDRGQHHHQEDHGEHGQGLPQPAEVGDQARVAALVHDPHQQEQRTGRDAVVQHLEQRTGHALLVQRVEAQHAEAQMADR
jgi:hypothetical protein